MPWMTVSLVRSTPSSDGPPLVAPHMSDHLRFAGLGTERDRHRTQRAVLEPRTVVVAHVRDAEDLAQREPGVRRALADAAVGDEVLAEVDALLRVELAEVVVGLEGAVVVRGLAPRDVRRGRHVAGG